MSDILTAQQLKDIALARLAEAKVLLSVRTGDDGIALYDGASYLAGYAVETALKAVICKLLGTDYPPQGATFKPSNEISKAYKTHSLNDLILLAGLNTELKMKQRAAQATFGAYWSEVIKWSEVRRYDAIGTANEQAVKSLIKALEDPTDGILTWLKTRW